MVTALKNGKATITITVKTTNTDFEKTLTYDITVEEIPGLSRLKAKMV